jgi:predicted small secreted protein
MIKVSTKIVIALSAVLFLASCANTIHGAAKDTTNAAKTTTNAVKDVAN